MSSSVPRERIVLYASLTALTAVSIDALLPGLRDIAGELAPAPPLSTQHIVSLFIFGMVFGELFLGPISDAIGRKRALMAGLGVYAIGTLVALLASSLEGVILGRVLQGIGVAGPKIATRAMIRDQFEGEAMARVMSFLFSLFILVPMVALALGQGVIALAGWRGMFALYLALALGLGTWLVLRQPETLAPERRIPFRSRILLANGGRILANRRVTLLIVATGFVFGAQLLYLSIAADLFADVYEVRETFPFYFALLAGGIGLASYLNGRLVGRFGMDTMARCGFLGLTCAGLLMLTASVGLQGRPPLVLLLVLGFATFFAIGLLFGNLNAMAMRSLGQVAGLGASLIASGSSSIAGKAYDTGYLRNWLVQPRIGLVISTTDRTRRGLFAEPHGTPPPQRHRALVRPPQELDADRDRPRPPCRQSPRRLRFDRYDRTHEGGEGGSCCFRT